MVFSLKDNKEPNKNIYFGGDELPEITHLITEPVSPKDFAKFDQKQVWAEYNKCKASPHYFIQSYIRITHPAKGEVPFIMYDFQKLCVKSFIEHDQVIVNKARQLGMSTVVGAYCLWFALFHPHKKIVIAAINQRTAKEIFERVKGMYETFRRVYPLFLKAFQKTMGTSEFTRTSIKFLNGSNIMALPRTPDVFRSHAISLAVIDEAGFISGLDEVWAGAAPALQHGGSVIIISSPSNKSHTFYDLWQRAYSKESNMFALKLPWNVHPDHDLEWYKTQAKNDGNPLKTARELDCEFTDTEGNSFFSESDIKMIDDGVVEPANVDQNNPDLWIWEHPIPGHRYVLAADLARGAKAEKSKEETDNHCFYVVSLDTGNAVAEFVGMMLPEKMSSFIIQVAKYYNNALVCPENQSSGTIVLNALFRMGYNHVYNKDITKYYGAILTEERQFITGGFINANKEIREMALGKLQTMIHNGELSVFSERFVKEMKTFIWKKEKAQASSGKHDDCIMAMSIAAYMLFLFGDKEALERKSRDKTIMVGGVSSKNDLLSFVKKAFSRNQNPLNEYIGLSSNQAFDPSDQKMKPMITKNWPEAGFAFKEGISIAEKKKIIAQERQKIIRNRMLNNPEFSEFIAIWGLDFWK